MENQELTWEQLEKSADENHLVAESVLNFKAVRENHEELFIENESTETEQKEDVMFDLLFDFLDFGKFKEESWELDGQHDIERSNRMTVRINICETVATEWVKGHLKNLQQAQNLTNSIVESIF